jgi:epoxyqueuosine reductase
MKDFVASERSQVVKRAALELGFSFCGISRAEFLSDEAPKLEKWLAAGKHGAMSYMENHFDERLDPRKLVPGAKSVVTLMYNYYTEKKQTDSTAPKISKYAYGEDYHDVVREKLRALVAKVQETCGHFEGRVFVDSAPILERAWAVKSGVGWMGKNTNIINKQQGSFFFLAELIIDLELQADGPVKDFCGTCTACIDACPTDAISEPYQVDGSKCISYLTIELKAAIPSEFQGKMDNWMFGCDICQDVCPWNRFARPHSESRFQPKSDVLSLSGKDWNDLSEEVFRNLFKGSAVKRTKFNGLRRNIDFLLQGIK